MDMDSSVEEVVQEDGSSLSSSARSSEEEDENYSSSEEEEEEEEEEDSDSNSLKCSLCNATYSQSYNLYTHARIKHKKRSDGSVWNGTEMIAPPLTQETQKGYTFIQVHA